ncbi:CAP domain-containing protein [Candidatus Acetothermia bacterium]|nr:CAP domain-containing protein [Candidatus Acetothermia bacterium]MBI3644224.1 CAP domain-containing protein [Candidatus Acetothermia bacterium]
MKRLIPIFLVGLFLLVSGWNVWALDSAESKFLELVNQYRGQSDQCYDSTSESWMQWPGGGSRTLTEAPSLTDAAKTHNQTMLSTNCFSHQCPGEPPFDERAANAGYKGFTFLAENIAAGYETGEAAFNGWRNSSGHNQNMLSCRSRAIGIARGFSSAAQYGWDWTTEYGDVIQLAALPSTPTPQPAPPSGGKTEQAYDLDHNCLIENPEFFAAVDSWISGAIDNVLFFQLVDDWIGSKKIC